MSLAVHAGELWLCRFRCHLIWVLVCIKITLCYLGVGRVGSPKFGFCFPFQFLLPQHAPFPVALPGPILHQEGHGVHCMFTKSGTNHRNFYINITTRVKPTSVIANTWLEQKKCAWCSLAVYHCSLELNVNSNWQIGVLCRLQGGGGARVPVPYSWWRHWPHRCAIF